MIDWIPNTYRISSQTVTIPFSAICSITNEPFSGDIMIVIDPNERCLEYCSVDRFVKELYSRVMTHEQVAREVFNEVESALGPRMMLFVEVRVTSAVHPPAVVRCTYSELGSELEQEE